MKRTQVMSLGNLPSWLRAHSSTIETKSGEVIFQHNPDLTSILLPRRSNLGNRIIPVENDLLDPFYQEFGGASIGNSHILIAANLEGGKELSHGFRLPDLHQMARTAQSMNIKIPESEHVFMSSAGWMFFYTVSIAPGPLSFREYDRDFGTCRLIHDIDEVFDSWWDLVEADRQ